MYIKFCFQKKYPERLKEQNNPVKEIKGNIKVCCGMNVASYPKNFRPHRRKLRFPRVKRVASLLV